MNKYKITWEGLFRWVDLPDPLQYWQFIKNIKKHKKIKKDYYFEAENNKAALLIYELGEYE